MDHRELVPRPIRGRDVVAGRAKTSLCRLRLSCIYDIGYQQIALGFLRRRLAKTFPRLRSQLYDQRFGLRKCAKEAGLHLRRSSTKDSPFLKRTCFRQ